MKRLAIAAVMAVLPALLQFAAADVSADEAERLRVEQIHRAVFADPFDEQKLQAYMATLPRVGDYYIVEGDLPKTEQELRAYVVANAESSRPADPRPELTVDTVGGARNYYADPTKRVLSYAIDRASFGADYELVENKLDAAARGWEKICPNCRIRFVHESRYDNKPSTGNTNFIVRQEPLVGMVALAFFPADPPEKRILRVAPSYATTAYDKIGVFRHELGHILGYRHEHIRSDIKGCYRKEPRPDDWVPLSTYDPKSVMHYPCPGGGSMTFIFSETDKRDHRTLYAVTKDMGDKANPAGLQEPRTAETLREIFAAAVANPFDETRVTRFLIRIPRDGDYYVVEGDLLMTEQEVRAWLVAQSDEVRSTTPEGELLVNVVGRVTDYYQKPAARRLTYAVEQSSFTTHADYYRVIENMELAARAWENACFDCQIEFVHVEEQDAAPDLAKVNFIMRQHDTGGEYVAAAFFPHDPPERRYLNIDPSYFLTQITRIGILRHEIGHILGYRHEHIRGIRGCDREAGQWMPLTGYDAKSVMHYFCGGAGNIGLALTDLDREGHRKLYGPPKLQGSGGMKQPDIAECVAQNGGECVAVFVRFEGGNVPSDTAQVLRALRTSGAIEPRHFRLSEDKLLDTIVKRELNVPGLDPSLLRLIQNLNPGVDLDHLEGRTELILPRVVFDNYAFSVRLDTRVPEQEQELASINGWWKYLKTNETKIGDSAYDITLKGYQLELAVPLDSVAKIKDALQSVRSPNVNAYFPESGKQAPFFSYKNAEKYWQEARSLPPPYKLPLDTEGFIGSSVGLNEIPSCLRDCTTLERCPRIVVFDRPIRLHGDLATAIQEGGDPDGSQASRIEGTDQYFVSGFADKDKDHGTQIAGIIATQSNRYGLVGINPKAHIISLPYGTELREDRLSLQDLLQQTVWDLNQLYVFASDWEISGGKDPVGDRIKRQPGLWVVAAGDPKDKVGKNIGNSFSNGPMNLGDEANIIVVTACADCYGANSRLIESANYSTSGLVNLAAPGETIVPTPIAGGRYDTMGGTSQAAAFVGAVASSLLSCFDRYWSLPWLIKFRLLVTSNPKLLRETHRDRVSNGVLDATLALKDPTVSLLDESNTGQKPVEVTAWCRDTLSLYDPVMGDTLPGVIETKNVYRIVRDRRQMYVYTSKNPVAGIVEKHGPGVLRHESHPLLRTASHDVAGGDVNDLLLHERIEKVVDCK